jgi:hypothetical protein
VVRPGDRRRDRRHLRARPQHALRHRRAPLYLLVVLAAIGARADTRSLVTIALVCTGLTAGKLLAPPLGGVFEFGQQNRLIFGVLLGIELLRRGEILQTTLASVQTVDKLYIPFIPL